MKDHSLHQPTASMPRSKNEGPSGIPQAASGLQATIDDDRYPGSFFRVPGVPMPGKTTWSLAK